MGYALPATVRRQSRRRPALCRIGRGLDAVGERSRPAMPGIRTKSGDRFQAMQDPTVYARLCRIDRGGEGLIRIIPPIRCADNVHYLDNGAARSRFSSNECSSLAGGRASVRAPVRPTHPPRGGGGRARVYV